MLAPVLCVGLYNYKLSSKVAILRGKLPIVSLLFGQTLKHLNRTSLKHRGLNAHFVNLSPKIEDLLSPQTQDQVSAYACMYVSEFGRGSLGTHIMSE